MFSDDCRIEKVCFLRSQPFKNIIKAMVFIRIHIFNFFKNLMVSGTSWDFILEVWEVLRFHFHDSWRYLRLLEISMNFKVFSEAPQAEATQKMGGKTFLPRAHYYTQLGGCRRQNGTYSMEHGTYRLKGM